MNEDQIVRGEENAKLDAETLPDSAIENLSEEDVATVEMGPDIEIIGDAQDSIEAEEIATEAQKARAEAEKAAEGPVDIAEDELEPYDPVDIDQDELTPVPEPEPISEDELEPLDPKERHAYLVEQQGKVQEALGDMSFFRKFFSQEGRLLRARAQELAKKADHFSRYSE
jgi:hypothetical protein